MKNSILFLAFFIISLQVKSQKTEFSAVFYNVENLYDTIDDASIQDNDFLPQSSKKWNSYRYYEKLKHITQVIAYAGKWQTPDIIGLCEVENRNCLWALTHYTNLSNFRYEIVHYDSPDKRGIDVALLYNPKTFSVIHSKKITVNLGAKNTTRDILYVSGIMSKNADTLHVFVCHFPSRMGGKSSSEGKRIIAAQTLKYSVDSILAKNIESKILITGDCNDGPSDVSISQTLGAANQINKNSNLYTIIDSSANGTHFFKGSWEFLDQSIVSSGVIKKYSVNNTVIRPDFISEKQTQTGILYPKRTYKGNYYTGGYSDHYPIKIEFSVK